MTVESDEGGDYSLARSLEGANEFIEDRFKSLNLSIDEFPEIASWIDPRLHWLSRRVAYYDSVLASLKPLKDHLASGLDAMESLSTSVNSADDYEGISDVGDVCSRLEALQRQQRATQDKLSIVEDLCQSLDPSGISNVKEMDTPSLLEAASKLQSNCARLNSLQQTSGLNDASALSRGIARLKCNLGWVIEVALERLIAATCQSVPCTCANASISLLQHSCSCCASWSTDDNALALLKLVALDNKCLAHYMGRLKQAARQRLQEHLQRLFNNHCGDYIFLQLVFQCLETMVSNAMKITSEIYQCGLLEAQQGDDGGDALGDDEDDDDDDVDGKCLEHSSASEFLNDATRALVEPLEIEVEQALTIDDSRPHELVAVLLDAIYHSRVFYRKIEVALGDFASKYSQEMDVCKWHIVERLKGYHQEWVGVLNEKMKVYFWKPLGTVAAAAATSTSSSSPPKTAALGVDSPLAPSPELSASALEPLYEASQVLAEMVDVYKTLAPETNEDFEPIATITIEKIVQALKQPTQPTQPTQHQQQQIPLHERLDILVLVYDSVAKVEMTCPKTRQLLCDKVQEASNALVYKAVEALLIKLRLQDAVAIDASTLEPSINKGQLSGLVKTQALEELGRLLDTGGQQPTLRRQLPAHCDIESWVQVTLPLHHPATLEAIYKLATRIYKLLL